MATASVIEPRDSVNPLADTALVAELRRDAPGAARSFFHRHADRVYRTAYRVLRDRDAAEEVVQDTFVKAFDSVAQLRDASAAGPWLVSIAVRLAYDALRQRQRERRRLVSLDEVHPTAAPAPEPLVADHVRQAIARLSPKLQAVLVMYELEGHAHAEIASALDIPEATSKTRLFHARAALREALRAYHDPGAGA